jgi:hypothetical protein
MDFQNEAVGLISQDSLRSRLKGIPRAGVLVSRDASKTLPAFRSIGTACNGFSHSNRNPSLGLFRFEVVVGLHMRAFLS